MAGYDNQQAEQFLSDFFSQYDHQFCPEKIKDVSISVTNSTIPKLVVEIIYGNGAKKQRFLLPMPVEQAKSVAEFLHTRRAIGSDGLAARIETAAKQYHIH